MLELLEQSVDSSENCESEHSGLAAFTVVIPAYDEEGAIAKTIDAMHENLSQSGGTYEIIVVNDGRYGRCACRSK
jgi:cellulose synthase/poly-beta-1,6-N-acetylglucosamine synthase-like glycosyltransferase